MKKVLLGILVLSSIFVGCGENPLEETVYNKLSSDELKYYLGDSLFIKMYKDTKPFRDSNISEFDEAKYDDLTYNRLLKWYKLSVDTLSIREFRDNDITSFRHNVLGKLVNTLLSKDSLVCIFVCEKLININNLNNPTIDIDKESVYYERSMEKGLIPLMTFYDFIEGGGWKNIPLNERMSLLYEIY